MKLLMKQFMLLAGTVMTVLSSCSKQAEPVEADASGSKKVVLYAGTETISSVEDTRVYFSDWSTYQLYWANQDKISVFVDDNNYEFTNTASAGTSATFEGSIEPSSSYTALYPYNSSATLISNVVSTTFPAAQSAVADGTDKEALVAVAVSDGNNNLHFKNVYGIVKFEIVDDDVTSVALEGNNGEVLAGDVDITLGSTPSYVVTGNPSTEIVLTPDGRSTFVTGDYAIAALPVSFTRGFKLIFTHTGSIKSAIMATKEDTPFTLARNGGLNAKEMEFESTDYKYYYIRTKAELDAWSADIENWEGRDRVYLANDIDYGGGTWVTPTGKVFNGLFDGRGHSITNINITSSDYSGFLRTVTGAVKNLTIGSSTDASTIRSTASEADKPMGVVAYLQGGTIDNVTNYADLYMGSNTAYCGGIVGRVVQNGDNQAKVKNCKNYGALSCTTTRNVMAIMGGIAGQLDSGSPILKNNENYGSISFNVSSSAKKANIGGIAGQAICAAEISDCVNGSEDVPGSITVSGSGNSELSAGGILGCNQTAAATISGCYNYASITNHSGATNLYVGGIAGAAMVALEIEDSVNEGDVLDDGTCSDTYAAPTTDGNSRTGGILGSSEAAAHLTDCRNNGSVENNSASVYMNVGGILGFNKTAAAVLLRCINTNLVGSTPVNNSGNQVIRLGGMVAKSAVAGTSITYCENYGDVTLSNSYTIFRAWVAGGIAYCKYPYLENGKYYATLSRGTVSGGQIAIFVGQSDTTGGTVKDNGLGGSVDGTAITDSNYSTGGGLQFGSKSGSWTRTGNYFLDSKPVIVSLAPGVSLSTD